MLILQPELADYLIKRKSRQVKRFGMVEHDEDDDDEDGTRKKFRKEEDQARRAARKALAHVWSKTERMNCERALLSFGIGRWSRIKDSAQARAVPHAACLHPPRAVARTGSCLTPTPCPLWAQGGTKLREEEEIAKFGLAFVALCVGVPVGTVRRPLQCRLPAPVPETQDVTSRGF